MHWNMACLANAMVPLVEMESPGADAADIADAMPRRASFGESVNLIV
jgi:hypothetical protein